MRKNIVLDTNTVLSAMLFLNSISRKAYDKALDKCQIVVSNKVWAEYTDVFMRPKFDKYLEAADRFLFLISLQNDIIFIEPTETITDCRDPKDNKYLELAVSADTPFIITGDNDLLVLNPYRGIFILKSSDFLEIELV
jgi:hypothetical protein